MNKKSFLFQKSWWMQISALNIDDQKQVIYTIVTQKMGEMEPELMSEKAMSVWAKIKKTLEKAEQKKKEEGSPAPLQEEKIKKEEKDASSIAWSKAFAQHYPNLSKMRSPLILKEYQKLLLAFPYSLITSVLGQMEKKTWISKRYNSTYRTALNWMRLEMKALKNDGRWYPYQKELNKQVSRLNAKQRKAISKE